MIKDVIIDLYEANECLIREADKIIRILEFKCQSKMVYIIFSVLT